MLQTGLHVFEQICRLLSCSLERIVNLDPEPHSCWLKMHIFVSFNVPPLLPVKLITGSLQAFLFLTYLAYFSHRCSIISSVFIHIVIQCFKIFPENLLCVQHRIMS